MDSTLKTDKEIYSNTKINLFCHCAYDYRLRYELKVEPAIKSHHLVLGSAIHKANELRCKGHIDLPTAQEILKKELLKEKTDAPFSDMYLLGAKMLTSLFNDEHTKTLKHAEMEKEFYIEIADFLVRGFIDGILDSGHIYELKTSSTKYSEEYVRQQGFQWAIYEMGYRQLYGRPSQGIIYHVIGKGARPGIDFVQFKPTEKDLVDAKNWILRNVLKIRQGLFAPTPRACRWCDFKNICLGN